MAQLKTSTAISAIQVTEQGSAPATPASGYGKIYCKADGLYFIGDNGVEVGPLAAEATPAAKPNLITNGDFAGGTTGWSTESPATISVGSGQMTFGRGGGGATLKMCYQAITGLTAGEPLILSGRLVTANATTTGYAIVILEGAVERSLVSVTSSSDFPKGFAYAFTPNSTSITLIFRATNDTSGTVTIDDIKLYTVK